MDNGGLNSVQLCIEDDDAPDAIVKKLTDAKQSKQSKLSFCTAELDDDENVIRATLDLFRHSSAHGRLWEHLEFSCYGGPIAEIIKEATSLELFSAISLTEIFSADGDVNDTLLLSIFMAVSAGMKYNSRLEKVQLADLDVSSLHMAALKEGLKSANSHFKELTLEDLRFAFVSEDESVSELEAGLQGNNGLVTLHITACRLEDEQLTKLTKALVSNSSLRELSFAENDAGPEVLQALANYLLTNSKLESLNLSNQIGEHGIVASHIPLLAKGLKCNQYLKVLDLSGNSLDDQSLEDLTRTVWTCSKLEELDLTDNNITDEGLQMIASQTLPSSLRCLGLGFNNLTTRGGASHLLKILQDNAQLSEVRLGSVEQPSSPEIEHLLDFNQAGRVLLGQGLSVPLSLWPVVLERANKMFQYSEDDDRERKRANVVFLLLQGPALMQRRLDRVIDSAKRF